MNVSIEDRWRSFVDQLVNSGRYGSAGEVIREGLRLVEEREAKLQALRDMLDHSIAQGGDVTDAELDAALDEKAARLEKEDSECGGCGYCLRPAPISFTYSTM